MFEITIVPILVAAIASVALGALWYSPKMFGTGWMQMVGLTDERAALHKKKMPLHILVGFVSLVVMAYVLAHFGMAWGVYNVATALELGFWVWIGFQVPILLGAVLWELKPWRLFVLNAAYHLIAVMLMATILVFM